MHVQKIRANLSSNQIQRQEPNIVDTASFGHAIVVENLLNFLSRSHDLLTKWIM